MKLQKLQAKLFIFTFLLLTTAEIQPVKANIFIEKVIVQTINYIPYSVNTNQNNNQNNHNNYLLTMLTIGGIGFGLGFKFIFSNLRSASQKKDKQFAEVNPPETTVETQIEISKKDTSPYIAYIEQAYDKFSQGDIEGALKNFNDAIQSQPNNANLYNERAYFRQNKLGDKAGAIADYTKAIKMNPDNYLFYFCRSQTYLEMGDRQKAIDDYNIAMDIAPEDMMNDSASDNKK